MFGGNKSLEYRVNAIEDNLRKVLLPLFVEGVQQRDYPFGSPIDGMPVYVPVSTSEAIAALADALGYEMRAIPTGSCDKFKAIAVPKGKK